MRLNIDLILIMGGRLVVGLLTLLSIRAVTTLFSPEQFGVLALLVVVQMFCGLFFINPVGQYININTHSWWDDGSLFGRLRSYLHYILLASFLGGVASIVLFWQQGLIPVVLGFLSIFFIVFTSTWNTTLVPMLNLLGFRSEAVILQVLTAGFALFFSVFFVLLEPTAFSWLFGQSVGMIIGTFAAGKILLRYDKNRFDSHKILILDRKIIVSYCLPLALATGLMWLQLSGYRFFVEYYWGLEQLGLLVIGLQLASQVGLIFESLTTQIFYPLFYRRCVDHANAVVVASAYSDLINTLLPLYLLIVGLICATSSQILSLLVDPRYSNAFEFVIIGACVELCRLIGNLFSNAAQITRKPVVLTIPYGFGALTVLIILIVAGSMHADIIWVGYALMAGGIVMLIKMYKVVSSIVHVTLDFFRLLSSVCVAIGFYISSIYLNVTIGTSSLIWLSINCALFVLVALTLLWKNPATARLVSVKLRSF